MSDDGGRVAVVTGASSGIGAATAARLAAEGFRVVVGARRLDRLRAVAEPIGATALPLDVTDPASVEAFCAEVPDCALLVNNAGGALGRDPIARADDADWLAMYDSNVLGVLRMTRALLPALVAGGDGHVVTIGSIAAHEPYPGGGGYNAAKFAVRAVMGVLRQELLGQPVRVTEIDPGMVETEFSLVRFGGDEAQADAVYQGMTPLTADDVADCVAWAATRPSRVNIDQIVVLARDQAGARTVHRRS
ncbi:MAG: SDR family NAD(P)-dependent oxidoreductase [Acidimicrobiales bacterium]|nr:SDR family NAD(P)-dependent oxidoreductase [Acidimicrobiales bacterium]MCB1013615.1 SDR family NAD(P)-dependent oxidoreductase [Acidimicrobiales bacterium]MCB9372076.1 SDR family NAD(P)-dependent oxidoreductase [Microthrixaceae bacterium]